VGAISSGSCTIQSSSMSFSTDELMTMINKYGLNVAATYAPFGAKHIEASKTRPEVLKALQELRALQHTGVPMDEKTLAWGYEQGIPLQVRGFFLSSVVVSKCPPVPELLRYIGNW
jgi:acyl-coenzyme A synthetase/AMP-(fatty) acid ligase